VFRARVGKLVTIGRWPLASAISGTLLISGMALERAPQPVLELSAGIDTEGDLQRLMNVEGAADVKDRT
jgi:hypothetical protein